MRRKQAGGWRWREHRACCVPIAPFLQGSGECGHRLGVRTGRKCWDVEEGGEDVNQSGRRGGWGWGGVAEDK